MTTRREAQRQKRVMEQWEGDLRWLMAAPQGRRVVANLIARAGVGRVVFNGNSRDAFVLGRQSLPTELLQEIRLIALDMVHLMEVEQDQAQKNLAGERSLDEQQTD